MINLPVDRLQQSSKVGKTVNFKTQNSKIALNKKVRAGYFQVFTFILPTLNIHLLLHYCLTSLVITKHTNATITQAVFFCYFILRCFFYKPKVYFSKK